MARQAAVMPMPHARRRDEPARAPTAKNSAGNAANWYWGNTGVLERRKASGAAIYGERGDVA